MIEIAETDRTMGKAYCEIMRDLIPKGSRCSDDPKSDRYCQNNRFEKCILFDEQLSNGYKLELCINNKYLKKKESRTNV